MILVLGPVQNLQQRFGIVVQHLLNRNPVTAGRAVAVVGKFITEVNFVDDGKMQSAPFLNWIGACAPIRSPQPRRQAQCYLRRRKTSGITSGADMSISESILEPSAAAGEEVVLSSTAVELDWADLCIRTEVAVSEPDAADFALLLRGIAGDDGAGLWISADNRGIGRGFLTSPCAFSCKSFLIRQHPRRVPHGHHYSPSARK